MLDIMKDSEFSNYLIPRKELGVREPFTFATVSLGLGLIISLAIDFGFYLASDLTE